MSMLDSCEDAVVIGGGFYGAAIAIYLVKQRGFRRVTLLERESALLLRASYNNQARVHNGYHYPRSFTTAFRSRVNYPRFLNNWPQAIKQDFTKLYAIAARNSKVTARQFERFCRDIGASLRPANAFMSGLFEPRLIEKVFQVEECAFDSTKLASWALRELEECNVRICLNTMVTAVSKGPVGTLVVAAKGQQAEELHWTGKYVFNCTYSGMNQLSGDFPGTAIGLKHEIAEMALVQVPLGLQDIGITVMDGSFFSMMPFPARGLHTLSHVRYTPHMHWSDAHGQDPYQRLAEYDRVSRVDRMIRDVTRYMPAIQGVTHIDSLFEVKTVLVKNEIDDGRPILFEKHERLPNCYSILGGKIDNIYDALEKLESEPLMAVEVV